MTRRPSSRGQTAWLGPLLRRLVAPTLLLMGLAAGFVLPYAWVMDGEVRERFGALRWQEPTRVYARPLALAPGLPMDADTLGLELAAAAYREDAGLDSPGTFARDGGTFRIRSRGFGDLEGPVPAQQVEVRLAGGRVASLAGQGGRALEVAVLDPARIATLYGNASEERRLVRVEDVPVLLVTGLQAVEDRDFARHHGIDLTAIARAALANAREGEVVQGGSTLTQQLVRNLFLTREQTWTRKLNEVMYALIIEARFDKRVILEAYLNEVYLGQLGNQAIHGVAAGSEFWFGRQLSDLRSHEIALLVGMIRGPSYYDPRRFPERAKARRDLALGMMHETGLIDAAELERARAAPLGVSPRPGAAANRHPAFMDLVRRQLERDYPADALRGAGLRVMTTLAPSAQRAAERAVSRTLPEVERAAGPALQAGLVVTDTRRGEVVAVVGNRRVDEPGFNRALDAQRPVGSLLKPMVYLLALAQPGRWSLASYVEDAPIEVPLGSGRTWSPENSDGRSHGRVRLNDALAQSYNQATVRVGMDVGPQRLADLLRVVAGIEAAPNPALILGAVDSSPFAMAQAYQFLASGGQVQPLRAVRGVLDRDGVALHRYDQPGRAPDPGDAIATRLVGIALQQTVAEGTGRGLLRDGLGRLAIAGKTGTSNDSRDSWFAGYSGSHLAVAWVGDDRNAPTGLYGSTGAMRVFSALFAELPSAPLQVASEGLTWAPVAEGEVSTTDEDCPGARRYPFVTGFTPEQHRGCLADRFFDFFGGKDDAEGTPSR